MSFYLSHGRISFHKRIDLAILACLELNRPLKISGASALPKETQDLQDLVTKITRQNPEKEGLIEFLGRTSDQEYVDLLANCRAFLFPGKEDAGIAPLEVMAAGVPVIAYQAGGALEYVQDEINGLFFAEQTKESLVQAMLKFEKLEGEKHWQEDKIRQTTLPFSAQEFEKQIRQVVGF